MLILPRFVSLPEGNPVKLNPDDLTVSSFDTTTGYDAASQVDPLQPIITNDPTDATRCFICPMETYRCY